VSGKTEYVWMIFLGKRSFSLSRRKHHETLGISASALHSCCSGTNLKRITAICFSVYHFHDILMNQLTSLISISPIVCSTHPILAYEKVLWIIDVFIRSRLNTVDNLRIVNVLFETMPSVQQAHIHEVPGQSRWLLVYISYRPTGRKRHPFDPRLQLRTLPGFHLD